MVEIQRASKHGVRQHDTGTPSGTTIEDPSELLLTPPAEKPHVLWVDKRSLTDCRSKGYG
eukprot:NODE_1704_length_782_cov_152.413370_g1425_i0.p5 GENE.NODE_1704_length_782_cov_152.413370_g1425_i0~~NODE_1704_length_782_cov_152.413370_g1425_i0.p5  ORF type:complete len:60 (+),score=6.76 NODE_1704_length_782_cov_152.413370_g1425_i0:600-779(+)